MLQQQIKTQNRLEPHLLQGYYSFIGPANIELLPQFIEAVNQVAPVVGILRSIHHFLPNKEAVQKAIAYLPPNEPLRIYVVYVTDRDNLLYDTVEGYCKRQNITLDD